MLLWHRSFYLGSVYVTETQAKAIDAFQRRKLRQAIGIKWPQTISNEALYNRTKMVKRKIQKRRLNLFGHIMRLLSETPIRQSIKEALTKNQRPQGRPPTTWIEIIRKDLAQHFNTDMNITNNPPWHLCEIKFFTGYSFCNSAVSLENPYDITDDWYLILLGEQRRRRRWMNLT